MSSNCLEKDETHVSLFTLYPLEEGLPDFLPYFPSLSSSQYFSYLDGRGDF